MSVSTTSKNTPVEAVTEILQNAADTQEALQTAVVTSGNTDAVNNSETDRVGKYIVEGDLVIGGTLVVGDGLKPWTENINAFKWWEKKEKERGNGEGQRPEFHVWQPTSTEISRISADNTLLEELPPVEIHVMSLDENTTRQLARDLIDYLSEYMSDKEANTEYADIVPTSVQDFREAKLQQKTDHYVYVVEVEITKLTETGV